MVNEWATTNEISETFPVPLFPGEVFLQLRAARAGITSGSNFPTARTGASGPLGRFPGRWRSIRIKPESSQDFVATRPLASGRNGMSSTARSSPVSSSIATAPCAPGSSPSTIIVKAPRGGQKISCALASLASMARMAEDVSAFLRASAACRCSFVAPNPQNGCERLRPIS
jgi:hypothetical protein